MVHLPFNSVYSAQLKLYILVGETESLLFFMPCMYYLIVVETEIKFLYEHILFLLTTTIGRLRPTPTSTPVEIVDS